MKGNSGPAAKLFFTSPAASGSGPEPCAGIRAVVGRRRTGAYARSTRCATTQAVARESLDGRRRHNTRQPTARRRHGHARGWRRFPVEPAGRPVAALARRRRAVRLGAAVRDPGAVRARPAGHPARLHPDLRVGAAHQRRHHGGAVVRPVPHPALAGADGAGVRLSVHGADDGDPCADLPRRVLAVRAAGRRAADDLGAVHVLACRLSAVRAGLRHVEAARGRRRRVRLRVVARARAGRVRARAAPRHRGVGRAVGCRR